MTDLHCYCIFLQGGKSSTQGGLSSYRILQEQRPVTARVQILLIRMAACIASSVLWAVALLHSVLCPSAGPLQDSRADHDKLERVTLELLQDLAINVGYVLHLFLVLQNSSGELGERRLSGKQTSRAFRMLRMRTLLQRLRHRLRTLLLHRHCRMMGHLLTMVLPMR